MEDNSIFGVLLVTTESYAESNKNNTYMYMHRFLVQQGLVVQLFVSELERNKSEIKQKQKQKQTKKKQRNKTKTKQNKTPNQKKPLRGIFVF